MMLHLKSIMGRLSRVGDCFTSKDVLEHATAEDFTWLKRQKLIEALRRDSSRWQMTEAGWKWLGAWGERDFHPSRANPPAKARASALRQQLLGLRPKLAAAAQAVYDNWEQDEEEDEYGGGGICDDIADAMGSIICNEITDVEIFEGGQDGDDHAWVIAQLGDEAYGVDIPPNVYESGGGYNWKKLHDVTIDLDHVVVFPVPLVEDD